LLELPHLVAQNCLDLLGSGSTLDEPGREPRALVPQDLAVLVRTNAQGKAVREALVKRGLDAVFLGEVKLYETPEALDLARFLKTLLQPLRPKELRAALSGSFFGLNAQDLFQIAANDEQTALWAKRFGELSGLWKKQGFAALTAALGSVTGYGPRLLAQAGGEESFCRINQLLLSLLQETTKHHLTPSQTLHCLETRTNGEDPHAEEVLLSSDRPAVRVLTIHKSKGLQYGVVLVPFAWTAVRTPERSLWHEPDPPYRLKLDLAGKGTAKKDHPQAERIGQEALAEDLRLLYVALTRSKHQTHLYLGPLGSYESSGLSYLLYSDQTGALVADLPKLDSEGLWSRTEALVGELGAGAKLRLAHPPQTDRYRPPSAPAPKWQRRSLSRSFGQGPRIGSYSGLIAKATKGPAQELGRDLDPKPTAEPQPTGWGEKVPLWEFPRGMEVGHFFHSLFEHLNFTQTAPQSLEAAVRRELARFRLDPALWTRLLVDWLPTALGAPLVPGDRELCLGKIGNLDKLVEMEFTLPVLNPVNPAALAQTFEALGQTAYAGQLRKLTFQTLQGHLKGFVDLWFRAQGRYYVLDYKSNYLGPNPSDYQPARLQTEMEHHHYPLQAWIYALAAHRHLEARMAGYDYENHFGGVIYLFLRGLNQAGQGSVFLRPDRDQLEAFGRLWGGQEG